MKKVREESKQVKAVKKSEPKKDESKKKSTSKVVTSTPKRATKKDESTKKSTAKVTNPAPKTSSKKDKSVAPKLNKTQLLKYINEQLENNNWENDYQFMHSDYFFLRNLTTSYNNKTKKVDVSFTVEYKTNAHKIINNLIWSYSSETAQRLVKDMEKLELDIMYKTSDPDRTDQVFNKRFNRKLFELGNYASLGWIIKR